jgi:general secretion pathway protein D
VVDSWRNVKETDMVDVLLDVGSDYGGVRGSYENINVPRLLATPPPPPIGNGELVSFSITEEVSLKDVFIELGRLADIDVQVDPKINTGIILKITEKPINVVIEKICDLANLKYEYKDGILKVERDLPYSISYDIDILGEHDLWESIEESIEYLLEIFPVKQQTGNSSNDNSAEDEDKLLTEQKISVNKAAGIISVYANSRAQSAIENFIRQAKRNYASQVLIEAKVVEVRLNDNYKAGINWNLNSIVAATGSSDGSEGTEGSESENGNSGSSGSVKNSLSIMGAANSSSGLTNLVFNKKIKSKNLNVVIDAMQQFGNTKTISSPRINTLNNQKATLDFINTLVYFSVEKNEDGESGDGATKYSYTSTKQETDIGVKLEITPTIDLARQEITLLVNPELSSLVGYVDDPVNQGNKVPQVQKRTLKTSLKIKSGDVMVIGGLMSENVSNNDSGVPFLMNIPILGHLFKYRSKDKELTETVIFIKATIVDRDEPLGKKDRQIFDNFSRSNNYGEY